MVTTPLLVDVEKVLEEKSPSTYKKTPKFIIRYLKRIIHQDEINDFLVKHGDKQGAAFLKAALNYLNLEVEIKGTENIPVNRRLTFASNHPLGGMDGMALLLFLSEFSENGIKVFSNDLLMKIKNLESFFMPVNKHGSQNKRVASIINDTFESDSNIMVFPAGLVSRRKKGVIRDLEWKKTFVTKSIEFERDIVPVHISGRVSDFFYNLANLRTFLGIKTNIEMLYLPNEMFKMKGSRITITFGKPISYKHIASKGNHAKWAEKVKEEVYKLT